MTEDKNIPNEEELVERLKLLSFNDDELRPLLKAAIMDEDRMDKARQQQEKRTRNFVEKVMNEFMNDMRSNES